MSNTDAPIGVILLAAGKSERFGADKRLVQIDKPQSTQQQPMLLTTLQQIRASGLPLFVVLRPGDQQWGDALDKLSIDWGICPEAAQGMGHSLAFGVHATQHWNGWLIALADMPFIHSQTYRYVADNLKQHAIVRPRLKSQPQRPAHPVGFQRQFACELMACEGDHGARDLLQKHHDQLFELLLEDDGIVRDIDRPQDLNV